jgi:hypothetical protein
MAPLNGTSTSPRQSDTEADVTRSRRDGPRTLG